MMKRLSKIISYLLHPIILPTAFAWMVLNGNFYLNNMLKPEAFSIVMLAVVIFTLAIPALIFVASRYLGIVESLEMHSRQERIFSVTVIGISSWFCWRILGNFELPEYYTDFLLVVFTGAAMGLIITFFKKFSLHVFGWSMMAFTLVWYIFSWQCFSVLFLPLIIALAGVVAWSRLELNAHTTGEIYLGFGFGLLPVLVLFLL